MTVETWIVILACVVGQPEASCQRTPVYFPGHYLECVYRGQEFMLRWLAQPGNTHLTASKWRCTNGRDT